MYEEKLKKYEKKLNESVDELDDEYDGEFKVLLKENSKYLKLFYKEMLEEGLSTKVINKYASYAEFYINDYLVYYEGETMEDGLLLVDSFFSYFFINKCMFCSFTSYKEILAAVKKFYKIMLKHNLVEKENYDSFLKTIKDNQDEWYDLVARTYNEYYW